MTPLGRVRDSPWVHSANRETADHERNMSVQGAPTSGRYARARFTCPIAIR